MSLIFAEPCTKCNNVTKDLMGAFPTNSICDHPSHLSIVLWHPYTLYGWMCIYFLENMRIKIDMNGCFKTFSNFYKLTHQIYMRIYHKKAKNLKVYNIFILDLILKIFLLQGQKGKLSAVIVAVLAQSQSPNPNLSVSTWIDVLSNGT